jgi:hypothetical protein
LAREGTAPITVHLPKIVRRQLKTLAAEEERKVEDMVSEALRSHRGNHSAGCGLRRRESTAMSNDETNDDIRAAMEAVQARPWPRTTRRQRGQVPSTKRLSINKLPDLHHRFKIACTRANLVMVAEVLAFIERRTTELEDA